MVLDHIGRAELYYGLGDKFKIALKFLQTQDCSSLEPGRYEISDGVFALVQSYTTKPPSEGFWESHVRYIDLQYVAEGVELIGYAPVAQMSLIEDKSAEKDLMVHKGDGYFVAVPAGYFAIFAPHEAHMPGIEKEGPQGVRKVVVKIPA